jgi:heme A synthase
MFIFVTGNNNMGNLNLEWDRKGERIILDKKFQILLAVVALLLFVGAFTYFTQNPLLWGTGAVAVLFMFLLFRIDPLSPEEK